MQPKYAQMVAPTWITPGCVQFLKNKKRFHTAWVKSGPEAYREVCSVYQAGIDFRNSRRCARRASVIYPQRR